MIFAATRSPSRYWTYTRDAASGVCVSSASPAVVITCEFVRT